MIRVGQTYTILDTPEPGMKSRVGEQIEIEQILDGVSTDYGEHRDFLRVRGRIEGRRGQFTLWAKLGAPRVGLCNCSYMSFPHKRTSKCLGLA